MIHLWLICSTLLLPFTTAPDPHTHRPLPPDGQNRHTVRGFLHCDSSDFGKFNVTVKLIRELKNCCECAANRDGEADAKEFEIAETQTNDKGEYVFKIAKPLPDMNEGLDYDHYWMELTHACPTLDGTTKMITQRVNMFAEPVKIEILKGTRMDPPT